MPKKENINPWMISTIVLVSVFVGYFIGSFDGVQGTDRDDIAKLVDSRTAVDKGQIILSGSDGGDGPTLGDSDAPIVIQEFSDYQCPYCKRFYDNTMAQIKSEYVDTGKVRIEFYDYPLSFHQNARSAAVAAHCASDQGNYWGMHDALFDNYDMWANESNPRPQYVAFADALGLKTKAFETCLDSGKFDSVIDEGQALGVTKGITGTPGFFINGEQVVGAQPFSVFKAIIDEQLQNAN